MESEIHDNDTPRDADGARELGAALDAQLPALRRFIAARAGRVVLAREEADDLAQSVCRDLLERVDRGAFEVRSDGELRQWLFGAAQLKLRARFRAQTAERRDVGREAARVDDSDPARRGAVEPRDSATPSRELLVGERRERVIAAIDRLPERDGWVLRQAVFEGRSHAELAQELEVTTAHSRVLLSRALAKLARELGDDGGT